MDVKTTQQVNLNKTETNKNPASKQVQDSSNKNFSDELNNVKKEKIETSEPKEITENQKAEENFIENDNKNDDNFNDAIDGLKDTVSELKKINQKEELDIPDVKIFDKTADIKNDTLIEDNNLIDNNMNIQEPAEKLNLQTETGTNFGNNQPFSEFINKENNIKNELKSTASELEEEKAVLSTMEENIAIANKNMLLKEETKNIIVQNEQGIKKVSTKTNLTVDTIVSYDRVVMDKSDVDFFVNLVNEGNINIQDTQNIEKSARVSKTLADLLVKAMNENKPVRIDFDNNISVIIKIDRAGKISADFLPSSQVAEAYLKENLPLLRQKFDDNNINYNELNQRQRKQDNQDNRKKGRKDE